MKIILVALILISILEYVILVAKDNYFNIWHGYQLNISDKLSVNIFPTSQQCALHCWRNQFCNAANYYDSSGVCELYTVNSGSTAIRFISNIRSKVLLQKDAICGSTLLPNLQNTLTDITFRPGSVLATSKCALYTPGTSIDHCPVSTCGADNKWSSDYNISCTTQDCYATSALYKGKMYCTVSRTPCQRWNTDTPHVRNHWPSDPNDLASNYCRDPSYSGYLWCYTTDPNVRWEPCLEPTKC